MVVVVSIFVEVAEMVVSKFVEVEMAATVWWT